MNSIGGRPRRLRDFGSALRLARELKQRERWPRERLVRFQQARLEALVRHARAHSRFWRERLPDGPPRLDGLPTLDKPTMVERFHELVCDPRLRSAALGEHLDGLTGDELYLDEYRVMATSGSSGRKGIYAYDRAAWGEVLAQFLRYSDWAGSKPRLPRLRVAALGGGSPTHMTQRVAASVDVGLHRLLRLPVTLPLPRLVEELNAFRPDFINVYPSIAALLADEQLDGRLSLQLRGISTSSEPLMPEVRERLERAFGVSPVNLYGTTEGLWGCSCEAGSLHLFDDTCLVENVDAAGRPVPDGEPGERLLVTNLFNRVQPLIRFELPDAVTVDPDPCPCGRTLMRVRAVEGRSEDIVRLGGVTIHPLQFGFLTSDPAVREFQIVQTGERLRLRAALSPDANGASERLRAVLVARLREVGVAEPAVEVEVVDRLERSAAGKLRMVIAEPGTSQQGA